MSTIIEKLNQLISTKTAIKSALTTKGRNPSDVFSTYADEILAIQNGVELPTLTKPAAENNVRSGYEFIDGTGSKKTGSMPTVAGKTVTPTSEDQTVVPSGCCTTGDIVVKGVEPGLDTSDANASASDIASGKTAYVAGEKVTGKLTEQTGSKSFFNSTPSFSTVTGMFNLINEIASDQILRAGAKLYFAYETQNFGNATAADVAAGKIFTSAAGLAVEGTAAVGAPKAVVVKPTSRDHSLSIAGLPEADYGYLLSCNTIMLYGDGIGSGNYDIYSAICSVGGGTLNKAVVPDPGGFSLNFNDLEISIKKISSGISIAIYAESGYFPTSLTYYIVGFNV